MAETTTDIAFIMKLKDEVSTALVKSQTALQKYQKQTELTTKTAKDANTQYKAATSQLGNLNKVLVTLGITTLASGFAIKTLVSAFESMNAINTQTQYSVALLGPAAQTAYNQMQPAFKGIGASVLATASQVNAAYGIISTASGKTVLTTAELQGAFTVAKTAGVSFQTAAQAIGNAMRGNEDPLRQLVGVYGYKGLSDVLAKSQMAFQNNLTPMQKTQYQLMVIRDDLSQKLQPVLAAFLKIWNDIPQPMKEAIIIFAGVVVGILAIASAIAILTIAFGALDIASGGLLLAIGLAITGIIMLILNWGKVWDWLQEHSAQVMAAIAILFGPLGVLIDGIILLIKNWGKVWDWLKTVAGDAWKGIKDVWTAASAWFGSLWDGIKTIFSNAWAWIEGIINDMTSAINRVIALADKITGVHIGAIPQLSLPTAPAIMGPAIPGMASGGIVTKPTIAMIGENYNKEAVVPLSKTNLAGGGLVINLYATTADRNALASFAEKLAPFLQQNNRRGPAGAATY